MPRFLAPIAAAATLRAGVYLVVGGVLAGAYVTLVAGFVQMAAAAVPVGLVAGLAGLSAVVVVAPFFLDPVRALQVQAVRTLLDVGADVVPNLPGPPARTPAATRWRGAAWFALHLLAGAVLTVALLSGVPFVVALVLGSAEVEGTLVEAVTVQDLPVVVALPLACVVLLALPYLTAALRGVLRQAAGPLLGPDRTARIAELEAQARRAAEQGRLARELHDSVGHALTVTTLQAAAAARQLDTDPAAARRSLDAVQQVGRAAMADLDHVLGLLRQAGSASASDDVGAVPPARRIDELDALAAESRNLGHPVELSVSAAARAADLPRATAHEVYRIVQECLTNALRHAPGRPVRVDVGTEADTLVVTATNPVGDAAPATGAGMLEAPGTPGTPGTGSGLRGIADRVRLLHGTFRAGPRPGPDGPRWTVRATFEL